MPASSSQSLATQVRKAHARLAPLVMAPLLITVISGMSYRIIRDWGGVSRDQAHLLMVLHEGEWLKGWLGPDAETCYVVLNGLGLLWMLSTGLGMAIQPWLRTSQRTRKGADTLSQ